MGSFSKDLLLEKIKFQAMTQIRFLYVWKINQAIAIYWIAYT